MKISLKIELSDGTIIELNEDQAEELKKALDKICTKPDPVWYPSVITVPAIYPERNQPDRYEPFKITWQYNY